MSEENVQEQEPVKEVVEETKETFDGYQLIPYDVEMSSEIGELAGALAKAQGMMHNGKKDVDGYNYSYMALDQLVDIIREPFAKNGLAIIQPPVLGGRAMPTVIVNTVLTHESGQWIKCKTEIPLDVKAKGVNMAQMVGTAASYARRYSLQSFCNIASENDTDGVAK